MTSFEPFRLRTESRGAQKKETLRKILEDQEEERKQLQSSFRARSVPDPFDLINVGMAQGTGARPPKPPTEPKPFNLTCVALHERSKKNLEKLRATKAAEEKRMSTSFKARPSSALNLRPRQPLKPLQNQQQMATGVLPIPVKLKSAARAQERRNWNEMQKVRRAKLEEEKMAEEEDRKKAEKMEVQRLRKTLEFKARPLPKYLR